MLTVCVCISSGNTEPADDFDLGQCVSFLNFCLSLFLFFFFAPEHVRVSNDFLVCFLAGGMCPLSTFDSSLSFL